MDTNNLLSKSGFFLLFDPAPYFTTSIQIKLQYKEISVETLLYIGALICFINKKFIVPKNLNLVKNFSNTCRCHWWKTSFIKKSYSRNSTIGIKILKDKVSNIVFNVIQWPPHLVILRLPWFILHNLDIDWHSRKISLRSRSRKKKEIHLVYLGARAFMRVTKKHNVFAIYATLVSTLEKNINRKFHPQYYEFKDIFKKKNTNILAEH